uniref:Uncharacterized protein n=1 Tax=viral metagenome TaxID=1070528 RepID=A0A2V0R942_9ZZZZ
MIESKFNAMEKVGTMRIGNVMFPAFDEQTFQKVLNLPGHVLASRFDNHRKFPKLNELMMDWSRIGDQIYAPLRAKNNIAMISDVSLDDLNDFMITFVNNLTTIM